LGEPAVLLKFLRAAPPASPAIAFP
jgi:hypothetical protein